jgi:hypothetical protein
VGDKKEKVTIEHVKEFHGMLEDNQIAFLR